MKLVYTTCSDEEEAEKIGQLLVEEKLVACTDTSKVDSCYLWEGTTHKDEEVVLLAKTLNEKVQETVERIKKLHSYSIPCIIVIDATANASYEEWMRSTLNGEDNS